MPYTVSTHYTLHATVYRRRNLAMHFPRAITLSPAPCPEPALSHSNRARAGMQTLQRSPPNHSDFYTRVFQLFCPQTWSGYESKFHVGLKNKLVDSVTLKPPSHFSWSCRGGPHGAAGDATATGSPQPEKWASVLKQSVPKKGSRKNARLSNSRHMYKSKSRQHRKQIEQQGKCPQPRGTQQVGALCVRT